MSACQSCNHDVSPADRGRVTLATTAPGPEDLVACVRCVAAIEGEGLYVVADVRPFYEPPLPGQMGLLGGAL